MHTIRAMLLDRVDAMSAGMTDTMKKTMSAVPRIGLCFGQSAIAQSPSQPSAARNGLVHAAPYRVGLDAQDEDGGAHDAVPTDIQKARNTK